MDWQETASLELLRTWNRKLYVWWESYNAEYLSGALKRPIVQISQTEGSLGGWDAVRRVISISESHIVRDPWLSVMETLRHEMAHQYACEVLGGRDGRPHGDAFRKACERLRCSPAVGAAEGDLDASDADGDTRLLRVLKKVLSLAGSPNENEAQAAVQKARHLLAKYNIELVELDAARRYGRRRLGRVKGRHASYELWLASILNAFFFVEVLWTRSYDALRDRPGTVLEIYGTAANLDMAEYVYSYLANLLDPLWASYRSSSGLRDNRERLRYFAGVLEGFHRKLAEQETTLAEEHALVWKGDPGLRDYYRHVNPRVHTRYGGGVSLTEAYRDGLREGRRVSIHRPIGDSSGNGGKRIAEGARGKQQGAQNA